MLLEKIEFREALQILAKKAGVELKTDTIQDVKSDERATLMKLYDESMHWYERCLKQPEAIEARNYIHERGISEETQSQWNLGYSDDPREMFEHMKKK